MFVHGLSQDDESSDTGALPEGLQLEWGFATRSLQVLHSMVTETRTDERIWGEGWKSYILHHLLIVLDYRSILRASQYIWSGISERHKWPKILWLDVADVLENYVHEWIWMHKSTMSWLPIETSSASFTRHLCPRHIYTTITPSYRFVNQPWGDMFTVTSAIKGLLKSLNIQIEQIIDSLQSLAVDSMPVLRTIH